jgi:hypothetical protein
MNTIKPFSQDWDAWLMEVEANLSKSGYRRYNQNLRSEDFAYWKTFYKKEKKIYQVGILFYDFRKYGDLNVHQISVQWQCILLCDDRIDLSVSKEIEVAEFEEMAKTFYEAMSQYCQ